MSLTARLPAAASLQHPQGGQRNRHQRRLGIFSELQRLARAVPNDGRQLFAERHIDFVEHRTSHRKSFRQCLAHANGLGTLTRKSECCRHKRPRTFLFPIFEAGK